MVGVKPEGTPLGPRYLLTGPLECLQQAAYAGGPPQAFKGTAPISRATCRWAKGSRCEAWGPRGQGWAPEPGRAEIHLGAPRGLPLGHERVQRPGKARGGELGKAGRWAEGGGGGFLGAFFCWTGELASKGRAGWGQWEGAEVRLCRGHELR